MSRSDMSLPHTTHEICFMNHGYTLAEAAVMLVVAALTMAAIVPPAASVTDRMAVEGAREALAGLIAEARVRSVGVGGVTVAVEANPRTASLLADGSVISTVDFGSLGVEVSLGTSGGEPETSRNFKFNALGLGKPPAQTVTFTRREVEKALVVSAYGRVRRR